MGTFQPVPQLWDHPRVCGEKYFTIRDKVAKKGSPPRVRGKARSTLCVCQYRGITPACAGKRISPCVASVSIWDHPRVCGEKINWYNLTGLVLGSPPRVRGKAFDAGKLIPFYGITPACAGKSLICGFLLPRSGDHPRVCGEKSVSILWSITSQGSPPRVRGKGGRQTVQCLRARITPACAGKSVFIVGIFQPHQDHPRVCGEK